MKSVVTIAIVGFGAQLVDGTLGMAYGVTSTTLLLTAGYAPAVASPRCTWPRSAPRWPPVRRTGGSATSTGRSSRNIGIPGAIGAFAGATFLSSLSTENAAPWMAGILLALGVYLLLRFATKVPTQAHEVPPAQALPRPPRPVRRLRRRHRRRRLGTGRDPDPDQQRQDVAAPGHRHRRHLRVPRRRGREHRVLHRHRQREHPVVGRRCPARRWTDRRPDRGLPGAPRARPACSASRSAASSS